MRKTTYIVTFFQTEAHAPLLEGYLAIVVLVAGLEEGLDARLHLQHRGDQRDQLVVRHVTGRVLQVIIKVITS